MTAALKKTKQNTAGALIKAASDFHHHASADMCIAALPKGTLTQQAGLPRHQHYEAGSESVCGRREHTFTATGISKKEKNTEGFCDEDADKKAQFQRVAQEGIYKEKYSLGAQGWMEFSSELETFLSQKFTFLC